MDLRQRALEFAARQHALAMQELDQDRQEDFPQTKVGQQLNLTINNASADVLTATLDGLSSDYRRSQISDLEAKAIQDKGVLAADLIQRVALNDPSLKIVLPLRKRLNPFPKKRRQAETEYVEAVREQAKRVRDLGIDAGRRALLVGAHVELNEQLSSKIANLGTKARREGTRKLGTALVLTPFPPGTTPLGIGVLSARKIITKEVLLDNGRAVRISDDDSEFNKALKSLTRRRLIRRRKKGELYLRVTDGKKRYSIRKRYSKINKNQKLERSLMARAFYVHQSEEDFTASNRSTALYWETIIQLPNR